MRYLIVEATAGPGRWSVKTAAYEYRLSDRDDREILAYHWHPAGSSHVRVPHRHLGPGAEIGLQPLATAHLPTGTVSLAEVIGFAIDGLGARPLRGDWRRVLDEAQDVGSTARST